MASAFVLGGKPRCFEREKTHLLRGPGAFVKEGALDLEADLYMKSWKLEPKILRGQGFDSRG